MTQYVSIEEMNKFLKNKGYDMSSILYNMVKGLYETEMKNNEIDKLKKNNDVDKIIKNSDEDNYFKEWFDNNIIIIKDDSFDDDKKHMIRSDILYNNYKTYMSSNDLKSMPIMSEKAFEKKLKKKDLSCGYRKGGTFYEDIKFKNKNIDTGVIKKKI
jgi:hypothetical protein